MTSLPKTVAVSSEVLFQELGDETVLLDLEKEVYYGLDGVGARLWLLLSENDDPAAAVARLATEFDVDEARLHEDIAKLIGELQEAGLVTVTP